MSDQDLKAELERLRAAMQRGVDDTRPMTGATLKRFPMITVPVSLAA